MKRKVTMCVTESTELADAVYSMTLKYQNAEEAMEIVPGQFAGLFPNDRSTLLMRPISICGWSDEEKTIRFVYRVAGKGTAGFSKVKIGDEIKMLGILGNGYDVSKLCGKRVLLVGGGIGIPPMLGLAKALSQTEGTKVLSVMGYRNAQLFLKDEFESLGEIYVATDDGSVGTNGTVIDAIKENKIEADVICACGPMPMLRALKQYAKEVGIPAFISLEERMACGVGACLGCVAKTVHKDEHSQVRNTRVCTEGPVFDAEEVAI